MYRVLLVDDEVIVRAWLKKCVSWDSCGFEICGEASNGKEALEVFEKQKPDLILTDLRMPVMDGLSLLREIRSIDKRARFLILTCLDEFSLVKQAIELDITSYVLKLTSEPDEIERELIRVRNALFQIDGKAIEAEHDGGNSNGKNESNVLINQRLSAAVDYIEKNYCKDISISQVAEYVGVTPNYLGKLFLRQRNITFTDELNKTRIREAKRLLDDPSFRIYEVASKTGFSNTTYFFRVFKKYECCTPTEYRIKKNL